MSTHVSTLRGLTALSPVIVFLMMYVVVSVVIGDFYKMPFAVALLTASAWGILIYRGHPLTRRLSVFSRAAGHPDIIYMIWIFILAGAFASLATEIGSVEATVSYTLRAFPPQAIVPGLFVASCLISLAVGTSVGTVVALAPFALELSQAGGGNTAFYVAVVLGGAFFGDNLSFISDTTIAATRSQGCEMADKFRANLWIALPAAIVTLIIYMIMAGSTSITPRLTDSSPLLMLPYLIVIVTALCRMNVTIVLSLGITSAIIIGLTKGYTLLTLFGHMGSGIDSMGNLIVVTLLAAGMLGIIKACGGISWLLEVMSRGIVGKRGAQAAIASLVAIVNLCTANNTVAIITVGPLSRDIATRFHVDPRKSASLLDSCSCIVQCLIPYGAQTLLATSLTGISAAAPFPYLIYPWALALTVILSIIFLFPRRLHKG